jgi:diguanylate cyclase (GGDEF)-like protein
MVVESDERAAYDVERSLLALGYSVSAVVSTADEALDGVRYSRPDVVVMNVASGCVLDAYSAATLVHARHGVPVVLLGAVADEPTVAEARHANAYGYLVRPFSDAALAATLELALHRHQVERELAQKTALLEAVVDSMEDAVIATDDTGRILVSNDAASRMLGRCGADDSAAPNYGLFLPDQETRCPPSELPLFRAMRGGTVRGLELFVRSPQLPEGSWHSVNATPLRSAEGATSGGVMVSRNVTRFRALQEELQHLSNTDPLTGTYNRRGFVSAAKQELSTSGGSRGKSALFFVDLNGMKHINDTLGHAYGDQAIRDVTSVLQECFGGEDVMGRLGGDEFAVLSPTASDADDVTRRLRTAVEDFNARGERQYRLSISIGACSYDPSEPTPIEHLVESADAAMYRDKAERRARREMTSDPVAPAISPLSGSLNK